MSFKYAKIVKAKNKAEIDFAIVNAMLMDVSKEEEEHQTMATGEEFHNISVEKPDFP